MPDTEYLTLYAEWTTQHEPVLSRKQWYLQLRAAYLLLSKAGLATPFVVRFDVVPVTLCPTKPSLKKITTHASRTKIVSLVQHFRRSYAAFSSRTLLPSNNCNTVPCNCSGLKYICCRGECAQPFQHICNICPYNDYHFNVFLNYSLPISLIICLPVNFFIYNAHLTHDDFVKNAPMVLGNCLWQ